MHIYVAELEEFVATPQPNHHVASKSQDHAYCDRTTPPPAPETCTGQNSTRLPSQSVPSSQSQSANGAACLRTCTNHCQLCVTC